MDFPSSNPQHGWNPAWNMQSGQQSTPANYLPPSGGQGRPIIRDPEIEDEESNIPRACGYRDTSTNSTPSKLMGNTAKPKWGNSKGPRKKHELKKSVEGSSRGKSGKKDHRRNSSHSSGSSSHHQLRSTKTAQKISYAEPNNPLSSQSLMNRRASHNLVEKQYRNRLNDQFNTLLSSILPDVVGNEINGYRRGDGPERRVSKAGVLMLAKRHIEALETTNAELESEKEELKGSVQRLKGAWVNIGGEILP
ncbi:hypothetical protein B0J14DRAFT_169882 [Halenospora varia]|nr:hypothetical protein B0J14DRAFT_169882 [Halenospora varia]